MAHDDIPYSSAGSEDVYKHIKEAGQCVTLGGGNGFVYSLSGSFLIPVPFLCMRIRDVCADTTDRGNLDI